MSKDLARRRIRDIFHNVISQWIKTMRLSAAAVLVAAFLVTAFLVTLGTHANAQDIRGIAIGASKDTIPASCKAPRKMPTVRDCSFDDGAKLTVTLGQYTGKISRLVYVFKKTGRLTPESDVGKALIAKYGEARIGQIEKLEWPRGDGHMFARCDKKECRLDIYDAALEREDKNAQPAQPAKPSGGAVPKF